MMIDELTSFIEFTCYNQKGITLYGYTILLEHFDTEFLVYGNNFCTAVVGGYYIKLVIIPSEYF